MHQTLSGYTSIVLHSFRGEALPELLAEISLFIKARNAVLWTETPRRVPEWQIKQEYNDEGVLFLVWEQE